MKYIPALLGTLVSVLAVTWLLILILFAVATIIVRRRLTHEEAMHASELKKSWHDEKLYVRPTGH